MAKEFLINSIRQVRLDEHYIIPTVVLYKDKKCYVGFDAIDACDENSNLKENFKVEIGHADPAKLAQRRLTDGFERQRTVLGIAQDFIDITVKEALAMVERHGFAKPTHILIAEPLAIAQLRSAQDDWLKNYRASIRKILGNTFEEIDFMPEPFAVFQYYRHGIRHPLVAQKQKHVALVFDFGGGTFDVSVIETTSFGDISLSGRHSKPLAARSVAVGGFVVNKAIAEHFIFKLVDKYVDRRSLRQALDLFQNLRNLDEDALALHRKDHVAFVKNYRKFLQSVEQAKITICQGVANWKLDANLSTSTACRISVPLNPFHEDTTFHSERFGAVEFREIFDKQIWKGKLLQTIKETLKNAEPELDGKRISIVLLSGGSSNIRWLKPLIERDLGTFLERAEILELNENFQEIVAKGLAVECARRFYTEGDGDFRSITYNRLCLMLNPNSTEFEIRRYQPESVELKNIESDPGVLLPSSTSLKGLTEKPLQWKVKLSKAPTQTLDYFFMRSSFDSEEYSARHNLDSRTVTPKDANFGSSITVELLVRSDGTAEPSFVYGKGAQYSRNVIVKGKPFYMDMTSATQEQSGKTYLGFDFGTSSSSFCYIDSSDVKIYSDRASDKTWISLNNLISIMPYPAAYPLARYLSETSSEQMDKWGREAFEGMLTFIAYACYAEHCAFEKLQGSVFKGFRQRSAGPLWALYKRCVASSGTKWQFCKELLALSQEPFASELDAVVSSIAVTKHGKLSSDLNYPRVLERLGNVIAKMMYKKSFGGFEDLKCKPFSRSIYQGIFRDISGSSAPFVKVFEYAGKENWPAEFCFLVDLLSARALPISPFFVKGLNKTYSHFEEPDIYMYDIAKHGDSYFGFKAVQERRETRVASDGDFAELFDQVSVLFESDQTVEILDGFVLTRRNRD